MADGKIRIFPRHVFQDYGTPFHSETSIIVRPKRRSCLRRTWIEVFLIIILVATISLFIVFLCLYLKKDESDVCYHKDCIKAAARLLDSIDENVHPCQDFYQYACGDWMRKHTIPPDLSSIKIFSILSEELLVKINGLIERDIKDTDLEPIAKAKNLYRSCMNTTQKEALGLEPIKNLLNELGGWPLLSPTWDSTSFNFVDMLIKLRSQYNAYIISGYVTTDMKDTSKRILTFTQGSLGMPSRDYFLKGREDKMLKAYEAWAIDVATYLGGNPAIVKKAVSDFIEFEIELANVTMQASQFRDAESLYFKMTLGELQGNITGFDFMKYSRSLFNPVNITINEDEPVVVTTPEYVKKIVDVVKRWETRPEVIANYLLWRFIRSKLQCLPDKFRVSEDEYKRVVYGIQVKQPKWHRCASSVASIFYQAIGRLFVDKYFKQDAKSDAFEMISHIRDSFKDILDELDWIRPETKIKALAKASGMKVKVGYPEDIMNDQYLIDTYKELNITPYNYFENIANFYKIKCRIRASKLREEIDKDIWKGNPALVNAAYSPVNNRIVFPAGILQPPFYSSHYPKYLNFGGIGTVVGHEITHGFDDRGRQYNNHGNLVDWWDKESTRAFKKRAHCFVNQYNNFTIPEVNLELNGFLTQGENIADNGGIKEAYMGYQKWLAQDNNWKKEKKLPGINMTNDQLFFLNFAQVWCGKRTDESFISKVLTGVHSPGRFRVIGTLQNSPIFAKVYNCPLGSPMNPKKKCTLW